MVQTPYNLFAKRQAPSDLADLNVNGVLTPPKPEYVQQVEAGNYQLPIQKQREKATPVAQPTMPKQNPDTDGMDYLTSLYTSPEQEEKFRKASLNRQRILAVGDALRHIGNIYHTVKYSPSQQFNSPVQEEYGRYEREKGIRDAANQRYMSYQQAKAAQEEKARQWAAEQERKDREFAWKQDVDERNFGETKRRNDSYIAYQNENAKAAKARAEKTQNEANWVDRINEDKMKTSESQRWARQQQVAQGWQRVKQGWANYNLSVQRFNRGGGRGGGPRSLAGTSKNRDLFVSPDGSTYSFPKGTINSKNINEIYRTLERNGWFKNGGYATNDADKWDAIMDIAGSSKAGHDAFIYFAKRLGYEYEGGMDQATVGKYWGTSNTRPQPVATPKPQPKPSPKPQPKPKPAAPRPVAKPAAKPVVGSTVKQPKVGTNNGNLSKVKGWTL